MEKTNISDAPPTEHKAAHPFAFGLVKLPRTTFCGLRAKYVCGTVQPCRASGGAVHSPLDGLNLVQSEAK